MPEDKTTKSFSPKTVSPGANRSSNGRSGNSRGGRRGGRDNRPQDDMEQRILEIARVTRVMAGGKRMSFRACVAVGDKKSSVGVGLGKGSDVTIAINKAVNRAKKNMVKVPIVKETIPHAVVQKNGAALIMLKPARQGRGVISGGVTRMILELAGIKNITSKNLGSKSKINNARCVILALRSLRQRDSQKTKNVSSELSNSQDTPANTPEIKK